GGGRGRGRPRKGGGPPHSKVPRRNAGAPVASAALGEENGGKAPDSGVGRRPPPPGATAMTEQSGCPSVSGADSHTPCLPSALPRAEEALAPEGLLTPPEGPGEVGRFGPYRVLAVLGAGGM